MRGNRGLALAVLASVILFNLPAGRWVMYPFALLSTWIHECFHGAVAMVMGADFTRLVLHPDTSGYALYQGPPMGTLERAAVASAGYLGTALTGGALLALRRLPSAVRPVLGSVAVLLLLSIPTVVLSWGGSADPPPPTGAWASTPWWIPLFGAGVSGAWAAALLWLSVKGPDPAVQFVYHLIAAQTSLNAVLDIHTLFSAQGHSDADTMASLLWLPAPAWAALWLALAVLATAAGLRIGHTGAPGSESQLRAGGRAA